MMKFELDYIEKLVKLVSESDLTELALEDGEKAIVLRKEKEFVTASTTTIAAAPAAVSYAAPSAAPATAPAAEKAPAAQRGVAITSPMVGTFYQAASPGAKPFAEVGQRVDKGQAVCIIEAMKLMNEIEAEVSGTVIEICVEDGEPVEFGQVLMYVE